MKMILPRNEWFELYDENRCEKWDKLKVYLSLQPKRDPIDRIYLDIIGVSRPTSDIHSNISP